MPVKQSYNPCMTYKEAAIVAACFLSTPNIWERGGVNPCIYSTFCESNSTNDKQVLFSASMINMVRLYHRRTILKKLGRQKNKSF